MPINDVAQVTVGTVAAGPTQAGFGVPLILGAVMNASFGADKLRYYTSLAGMVSDGFLTTDPEYLAAAAILSQKAPAPPPRFAVGKRTNRPTMRIVLTVLTAVVGRVYSVTINGVVKSFTAVDTVANNVATGLAAAIGTPSGFGAAVASTNTVTLTASVAGNWVRAAAANPNVDLDCQQNNADAGVAADLAAIAVVDSTWYGLTSVFSSNAEVAAIAAWAEANGKQFIADTQDSTSLGAGTSDILSTLKAANYSLTSGLYHADNGVFAGAAWQGCRLPTAPGSENWAFAPVTGVPATALTTTQQGNLDTKRGNYVYSVAGLTYAWPGKTADGNYIDVRRGRDWTIARIQTRILTLQANLAALGKKIPYTDGGIAMIENELRGQYQEGVGAGYLAPTPAPTFVVPKASAVSTTDKTNRVLNNVTFSWPLAGAINQAVVAGVVSF